MTGTGSAKRLLCTSCQLRAFHPTYGSLSACATVSATVGRMASGINVASKGTSANNLTMLPDKECGVRLRLNSNGISHTPQHKHTASDYW